MECGGKEGETIYGGGKSRKKGEKKNPTLEQE